MQNDAKKPLPESFDSLRRRIAEISGAPDSAPAEVLLVTYDVLWDERGEIVDWILLGANERALQEIGLPPQILADKRATELFGASRPMLDLIELSREVMAAGMCRGLEAYFPWNDKHYFIALIPLNSHMLAMTALDITGRKRAEEALRESARVSWQRLAEIEAIYNSAHVGLCVFDHELRYVRINERLAEINGVPVEEHFGKTPREVVPNLADMAEKLAERIFHTGEPVLGIELSGTTPAQPGVERFWVEHWLPLKDEQGLAVGINVVVQEITERKQIEKALVEKREELMATNEELQVQQAELTAANEELQTQQEELSTLNEELQAQTEELNTAYQELREADRRKNEFLAVLSHELRNPLASIQSSLSILDRVEPGGEQAKRAKAVVDRQFGQLARLVDDLLDVTRITQNKIRLQRRRLELNELIRRTVEDHHSLFERNGLRLEAAYDPAAIFMHADGARLAQVVGNLLLNAAKFTRRGGSVRVAVAHDPLAKLVFIRVTDTGDGIPEEMLPCLFQPFMQADSTLDRTRGGLGLGLALSKGLVELHGGSISVHSAGVGQGSEFVVRLPLDDTSTEDQQDALAAMPQRGRRVLIIEDSVDLAESLRELLELDGHEVEVAYSGPEGLVKACDFQPEVLLCDIGLPGMDGYAVARAFRADETFKNVFLVALTGYALPEDLERAAEAGFDRHLAKPPDFVALERMLRELP